MLPIMSQGFFSAKIANATHMHINLRTWEVPKNPLGPSCGYSGAVRMNSKGYFGQMWSQAMSGLHIKPLLHADRGLERLSDFQR